MTVTKTEPMTKARNPEADKLNMAGVKLHQEGQLGGAYLHYLAALVLDPDHIMAMQNLSAALLVMEKFYAAETIAKKALRQEPDNAYVRSNLGVALVGLRRFKEAELILQRAAKALNAEAPILHNYGLALYMQQKFNEAKAAFDRSLELQDNSVVRSDRALTLLALGLIKEGLEEYRVRWLSLFNSRVWDLAKDQNIPQWAGEDLAGKKILVHHEQGFGDSLMLGRFLNDLQAKGAEVTVAVPPQLVRLFDLSFPFATVVDWESEPGEMAEGNLGPITWADQGLWDYHCPMLDLMLGLGIETPKEIKFSPYLKAEAPMVQKGSGLNIGLCWASGDHGRALTRRRRVVAMHEFLPLLELSGVTLTSLQLGSGREEIEELGCLGLIKDPMSKVEDFLDTANIIAGLDLVISVDSAVAHLAGAMGKPVIMLGPWPRCWRWWGKFKGSPWYGDFNIVQQYHTGDWTRAIEELIWQVQKQVSGK